METRQKLKRRVIELIHGLPYEEAIKKELVCGSTVMHGFNGESRILGFRGKDLIIGIYGGIASKGTYTPIGLPITIGRVMQALSDKMISSCITKNTFSYKYNGKFIDWQLTKENGQECTDDDQTDETIDALLKLLTN